MPTELPENASMYKRTATFTEKTVPRGLTSRHNTKAGVWGKLVVVEGQLGYVELDREGHSVTLRAGQHVVIEPTAYHRVEIIGPVQFFVEFHRE